MPLSELINQFTSSHDLSYGLVFPIIICLSRVADVIIGTIRIVFVIQGRKVLATMLGFCEVFLWITIASQIMGQMNNIVYNLAWALGFSIGTFLGMLLEEKISLGMVILRIIVQDNSKKLSKVFLNNAVNATIVRGESSSGEVDIFFAVLPRKKLKFAETLITETCPKALYTIENLRSVHDIDSAKPIKKHDHIKRIFQKGKQK